MGKSDITKARQIKIVKYFRFISFSFEDIPS